MTNPTVAAVIMHDIFEMIERRGLQLLAATTTDRLTVAALVIFRPEFVYPTGEPKDTYIISHEIKSTQASQRTLLEFMRQGTGQALDSDTANLFAAALARDEEAIDLLRIGHAASGCHPVPGLHGELGVYVYFNSVHPETGDYLGCCLIPEGSGHIIQVVGVRNFTPEQRPIITVEPAGPEQYRLVRWLPNPDAPKRLDRIVQLMPTIEAAIMFTDWLCKLRRGYAPVALD